MVSGITVKGSVVIAFCRGEINKLSELIDIKLRFWEWVMGNGEWGMGNGEWVMGNG